jgi:type IV secretion system protein VirB4
MKNTNLKYGQQSELEVPMTEKIPYSTHVSPTIVKTVSGDYLSIIKLSGIAFETVDDERLEALHIARNSLYKNISSSNVAFWTHIVRRQVKDFPAGKYTGFSKELNDRYKSSILDSKLFVNDLYLTVIKRKPAKIVKFASIFQKRVKDNCQRDNQAIILDMQDIQMQAVEALSAYNPVLLGTYKNEGIVFSKILEFLSYIVNADNRKVPLLKQNLANVIATARPLIGREAIEVRQHGKSVIQGALAIKEYASQTWQHSFDGLLNLPFEYVITQSFSCLNKQKSVEMMSLQKSRMENAGDYALSQIDEISEALDDLISNRFILGKHHFSLFVKASSIQQLNKNMMTASVALSDSGFVCAREDLVLESQFWAQLPANFIYRTRLSPISSKNFSGLSSFHNYPSGKISGNHWGNAITTFKTVCNTPFHFSFHHEQLGNTTVIGPSGSGKTVVMGMLLSEIQKMDVQTVVIDKDRGLNLAVNAMAGHYIEINPDKNSMMNPLQLEATAHNVMFLNNWLQELITVTGEEISCTEKQSLAEGLDGLMQLPESGRHITNLLSFLPLSLNKKLQIWVRGNQNGFLFDNLHDELNLDHKIIAIDVTRFLDDNVLRPVVLMYLFHRIEQLLNGQKFILMIDEGWKILNDHYMRHHLANLLKVIRKLNGLVIFGTNNASDATRSDINRIIVEQSPTKLFFPNPDATAEDYMDGFGLSQREFSMVKTLPDKSRKFLLKQGQQSTVAKIDLKDMQDVLTVLSGTKQSVLLMDEIQNEVGSNPENWLPVFHTRRKNNEQN